MTTSAEPDDLRLAFSIDGVRFAWGTLFDAVVARCAPGHVGTDRAVDVPCASVLGLATVAATVYAPPPARPIVQVSYAIGEAAALHTAPGLARALDVLERRLGAGVREEHARRGSGDPAGYVPVTVTWRRDPVTLTLSAFGGVRTTARGNSTGGLYLSHRIEPLAAPFVARFRAGAALFDDPDARDTATIVPAAGLSPRRPDLDTEATREIHLAFYDPHLARAPAWARERLGPDEVAIVRHPSGAWGLATRQIMWSTQSPPRDVAFTHERTHRAKGPGYAVLGTMSNESVLTTLPGERGLDLLADRLRAIGVTIRVHEDSDA